MEAYLTSELGRNSPTPGNVNRRIEEKGERITRIEDKYFGNSKMGDRTKVQILWYFYPALTGIIGAYYAHFTGVLSFRMVSLSLFATLMVMMLMGGLGQFPGVILGAFIVVAGGEFMNQLGAYRDVVMGGLAVLLVLLLPKGIMGLIPLGRRKRAAGE